MGNIFEFSYWVNQILSFFIAIFWFFQDITGNYKPPSAEPVSFGGNGGSWEGPFDTPLVGAAAANLPDGNILIWSAYGRDKWSGFPDLIDRKKTQTAILDPIAKTSTEELVVETDHDMFCPGTAYLTNQTVMITGGTTDKTTTIYDLTSNTWTRGADMVQGRGYHAMTLLGDGSVLTLGGSFSGGIGDKDGEIWWAGTTEWTLLSGVESKGSLLTNDPAPSKRQVNDNHMWLFTAPNTDRIFHAGPSKTAHWIDVTGSGDVIRSVIRGDIDQMCGNAVMYDVGKILVLGGSKSQDSRINSYREAYVYDINDGENVHVERVGDMNHPRIFSNAVALPNGEVVVFGGQTRTRKFSDLGGVLQAELWSPATKQFSPLASMQIPRNYHGACIFMKDGRVACMGGGLCIDIMFFGGCNNHPDYEIFTPPYLLNDDLTPATRPNIISSASSAVLGDLIDVTTDTPCSFAIVRLGAVTHSVNNDLRRVPLVIESNSPPNTYSVRIPTNANVVLPGMYWLFALNADGVPSEGSNLLVQLPP